MSAHSRRLLFVLRVVVSCFTAGACASGAGGGAATAPPPGDAAAHRADPPKGFAALGRERGAITTLSGATPQDREKLIEQTPRSLECADAIVHAQWQQDIAGVADPEKHFDNCQIDSGLEYLRGEYGRAREAAGRGEAVRALHHLGHVLHSLEDFYAHTDFVEFAVTRYDRWEAVPTPPLWRAPNDGDLAAWLPGGKSGTIAWERGTCPSSPIGHKYLNKDNGDSERGKEWIEKWGLSHYRATFNLTRVACSRFLKEAFGDEATWRNVLAHCGTDYGFALTFDKRKD
ncbi:MAG TPA: HET-C-related protein [Polyangiaceae bacterium]|nr:HET-C-related protein [Polyangiaceae bacterium]